MDKTSIAHIDGEIPAVLGREVEHLTVGDKAAVARTYKEFWFVGHGGRRDANIDLQCCDALVDGSASGPPAWGYFLLRAPSTVPTDYTDYYVAGFGPGPEHNALGAPMAWMIPLPADHAGSLHMALKWLTPQQVWDAIRDGRDVLRHGDVYLIQSPAADRRLLSPRVYVAHVPGAETLPESHQLVQHAGKQHYVGDDMVPNLTIEHVEHGALEIPPTWYAAFGVERQPRAVDTRGAVRDAVSGYIGGMAGWD